MKDLYNEFFHIPEDGKIQDKVMVTRVSITVIAIALCLLVMSFTAYSYFAYNVTSTSNVIQTANFEIEVAVEPNIESRAAVAKSGKSFVYDLLADTEYTFTVKYSENSTTKTGFCSISIDGSEKVYYTEQVAAEIANIPEAIVFSITPKDNMTITLAANWGTSSFYGNDNTGNEIYIENNEKVTIELDKEEDDKNPDDGAVNGITVPDTTKAPETTKTPETTKSPETTKAPETTKSPETTKVPDTTKVPETTDSPEPKPPVETTASPETTKTPETTAAPETTVVPETTTEPIAETTAPEEETTTAAPETTTEPEETTISPETTVADIDLESPEGDDVTNEETTQVEAN